MVSADSESEHEPQVSDEEYEPQGGYNEPQNQEDDNNIYDNEPTPKKKQKNMKVPLVAAIFMINHRQISAMNCV